MPYYVFNKNRWDGKYHEVHETSCSFKPTAANSVDLGWHSDCKSAIQEAKNRTGDYDFDGCKYCSPSCHKG